MYVRGLALWLNYSTVLFVLKGARPDKIVRGAVTRVSKKMVKSSVDGREQWTRFVGVVKKFLFWGLISGCCAGIYFRHSISCGLVLEAGR